MLRWLFNVKLQRDKEYRKNDEKRVKMILEQSRWGFSLLSYWCDVATVKDERIKTEFHKRTVDLNLTIPNFPLSIRPESEKKWIGYKIMFDFAWAILVHNK